MACIGALLMILAIGIDPTVQQTIVIRTRQIKVQQRATVPRAMAFQQYTAYTMEISNEGSKSAKMRTPTSPLMGAAYSGLFLDSEETNGPSRDVVPSCPTGSCPFPTFQSLGACAVCKNVTTSTIRRNCKGPVKSDEGPSAPPLFYCTWSLPNGVKLNQTVDQKDNDFGNDYLNSNNVSQAAPIVANTNLPLTDAVNHGGVFLNVTILRGTKFEGPQASQCTLSWCVNTYRTSVKDGKLTEDILDSWYTDKALDFNPLIAAYDRNLTPPAANASDEAKKFFVEGMAAISLTHWMRSKFNFSNSMARNKTDGGYDPDISSSWYNVNADSPPIYDILRVFTSTNRSASDIFGSVAKALTTYIRSIDSSENGMIEQEGDFIVPTRNPVVGEAWSTEVYVAVRWPWLAFSGSLLLLTIAFLVLVMAQSARKDVAVWKSSPLALIFHGLSAGGERVEEMRGSHSIREMERKARDIRVRLRDSGGGSKLEEEQ
jgi:hypothetical protein